MDGRSRDTTMGFTPLEGLVMATRPGNIDAGILLWLEQHEGVSPAELSDALEHRSGLLGLTGTADMKQVLLRAESGDPAAQLGLDVYIHRLRAGVASMAAAMGGLDALVFTGGVGENAPAVRQSVANGLRFLGVAADPALNEEGHGDREIGREDAGVRTLVVMAREDLEIARQVREVMSAKVPSAHGGHRGTKLA
jgi:acetate kinase